MRFALLAVFNLTNIINVVSPVIYLSTDGLIIIKLHTFAG